MFGGNRSRGKALTHERWQSIRLVLLRQMPPPIYGREIPSSELLLTFAQHAPGPGYLAPKLRHLADNGYQAVTTREYAEWLAGAWRPKRPAVLLTFDDGLRDFARVTYPILKRFGFPCTLFVCPGLVDLASRGVDAVSELAHKTILTWDELRDLCCQGDVDVQCHGMWHNRVSCSSRPVSVGVRSYRGILDLADLLPPDGRIERVLAGQGDDVCRYACQPLYACHPSPGGPVSEPMLRSDLADAKARIEECLPGHAVRALALPWWTGSPATLELARAEGYTLVFWGLRMVHRRLGRENVDPLRIGRLGFDWIYCLPGTPLKLSVVSLLAAEK